MLIRSLKCSPLLTTKLSSKTSLQQTTQSIRKRVVMVVFIQSFLSSTDISWAYLLLCSGPAAMNPKVSWGRGLGFIEPWWFLEFIAIFISQLYFVASQCSYTILIIPLGTDSIHLGSSSFFLEGFLLWLFVSLFCFVLESGNDYYLEFLPQICHPSGSCMTLNR